MSDTPWPQSHPSPRDVLKDRLRASLKACEAEETQPAITAVAVANAAILMMQGYARAIRDEKRRLDDLTLDIEADIERLKKLGQKCKT